MEQLKQQLQAAGILYKENEPLSAHCTFRIGGPADLFVMPRDEDQLCQTVQFCKQAEIRYYLLGNGSNILFADEGYRGAVIDTTALKTELRFADTVQVTAGAGQKLSALCTAALEHGLTGLEFAYGIPGTVGGAVYMNAGAYGGELQQVVRQVTFLHADGRLETFENEDCAFGYRTSVFENMPGVIVSARLALQPGEAATIEAKMRELMEKRRASQPLELPSAGSTFKRPAGHFAGPLIQDAGLKGRGVGGAKVSEKHAGFVVNFDHATAADVRATIALVQNTVYETSGVRLEPEVRIW